MLLVVKKTKCSQCEINLKYLCILLSLLILLPGISLAKEVPRGLPISFYFKTGPNPYFYQIMSIPPAVTLDPNQDWIGIFSYSEKCIGGGLWEGINENQTFLSAYSESVDNTELLNKVIFRIWKADKNKIYDVRAAKSSLPAQKGEGIDFSEIVPFGMSQMAYEIAFENKVRVANNELKYALWFLKETEKEPTLRHIQLLEKRWRDIQNSFDAIPPVIFQTDVHWGEDLAEVNKAVIEAKTYTQDTLFPQAIHSLNTLRQTVSDLRSRNRVILFGDLMFGFQKDLEKMCELIEHATSSGPTMELWKQIDDQMPQLYLRCLNVTRFVPKGLSKEEKDSFDSFRSELEQGIRNVQAEIEKRQLESLIVHIEEVKRIFWSFYLIFA